MEEIIKAQAGDEEDSDAPTLSNRPTARPRRRKSQVLSDIEDDSDDQDEKAPGPSRRTVRSKSFISPEFLGDTDDETMPSVALDMRPSQGEYSHFALITC